MNPTMDITGEFVFFWYVIAPTLMLTLIFALGLAKELGLRLRSGWKRLRGAWPLRPSQPQEGEPAAQLHGPTPPTSRTVRKPSLRPGFPAGPRGHRGSPSPATPTSSPGRLA